MVGQSLSLVKTFYSRRYMKTEIKASFRSHIHNRELYLNANDILYYFKELEEILRNGNSIDADSIDKFESTLKQSCIRILKKHGY